MRTLVLLALAGCAFGQQRLNPSVGQGNILHPGIPSSGPPRGPVRGGGFGGGGFGGYRGRAVFIPYGVPFDPFYSGYANGYGYDPNSGYDSDYPPGYGYDPNGGYGAPGPTPGVVVNPNFQPEAVHPTMHDYTNTPLPPSGSVQTAPPPAAAQAPGPPPLRDDQPTIFLIAMKDHTIYPVIAYWVDKDTLNYVTVDTVVKRVPMSQVDRDLSIQLNDQRDVEFKLPLPASAR